MIELGFINKKFYIDCSKLEYITKYRYLFILNYLKNEQFIPDFIFLKDKQYLVIKDECLILNNNNCTLKDILYIDSIVSKITNLDIKFNYFENIPFLQNINTKQIYFINVIWSTSDTTNKLNIENDLDNNYINFIKGPETNRWLMNNFVKKSLNYSLDIKQNILIYYFIKYTNINSLKKLFHIINNSKYNSKSIRYILLIKESLYETIHKFINKDIFNKYYLIKINKN